MSTSKSTARIDPNNTPFALQRRRTIMACLNCRKRKMRCITTEQPPKNPCARCTRKGLACEYVAAEHDEDSHCPEPRFPTPPESSANRGHPRTEPPSSWAAPSMPALPLPYTMPPPPHRRPRYSGTNYPDLSLSGSPSNEQTPTTQYYAPSQTNNAMLGRGYNPHAAQTYQYMATYGPPGGQPGTYAPGTSGPPQNYEQMPYYGGDMTMPGCGWPAQ
ncbi:hypothetical protein C8R45DRAFT_1110802 [Mycena sanguinolenta]|nr:hypothetical protein C8R45DRAFT_1110802 [Mycena sanguinolenta]